MKNPTSPYFRSEVDGLRAVAVLAIFAFHLELPGVGGGFVGVDIFFVISGYVITMGIMRELDSGGFSLQHFYLRRLRRIMPALLVVLLCVMAAGHVILSPSEYKELADSALATLAFSANFFFHDRVGYFAAAAHSRPLLHMWSLGIEEQFYIFIPLLVSALRRFRGVAPLKTILAVVVLSFLYGQLANAISEKHAFYMPMARFWEIAVGGAVACAERHLSMSDGRARLLAGLGILAIGAAIFLLDNTQSFPGWIAAIPVLGTAAVIAFARQGWIASALSVRPLVVIGGWSYSIYLVHWPIIVYWRLCVGRPLAAHEQVATVVLVFALAALLSRLVERPMRTGSGALGNRPALVGIACGSIAVLIGGALVSLGNGAPWRMNASAKETISTLKVALEGRARCKVDKEWLADPKVPISACRWNPGAGATDFVVWGDSHAGMIAPELSDALSQVGMKSGVVVVLADCFPLVGIHVEWRKNNRTCPAFVDAVVNAIRRDKPRVVVMASRWANVESPVRSPGDGGKSVQILDVENGGKPISLADALVRTIERLNTQVIILGPVPEIDFHVPNTLIRSLQGTGTLPQVSRSGFDLRQKFVLEAFARMRSAAPFAIVYPHTVLCDQEVCAVADGVRPLYVDDDHLSPFGIPRVMPLIERIFAR
jgi:peptidoglycan/LPS O-acetylase OafA/YrhL